MRQSCWLCLSFINSLCFGLKLQTSSLPTVSSDRVQASTLYHKVKKHKSKAIFHCTTNPALVRMNLTKCLNITHKPPRCYLLVVCLFILWRIMESHGTFMLLHRAHYLFISNKFAFVYIPSTAVSKWLLLKHLRWPQHDGGENFNLKKESIAKQYPDK